MKSQTAVRWARNPLLAALVLLAFCARALVAPGFMPAPGGLILCHGYTLAPSAGVADAAGHDMAAMADMEMSHPGPQSSQNTGTRDHTTSTFCPFATAATAMASAHTLILPTTVRTAPEDTRQPSQSLRRRTTIALAGLPRGPPATA